MKLEGKVALITGGGSGIGKAAALALVREGAKVALFGRRAEPLRATAEEIRKSGGEASPITGSVANDKDVINAVDKTVEIYGKIDILINNAGVGLVGPLLHQTTNDDWKLIVGTNLEGAYRVTRAVIPHFLHNNGGVIVNVSSTAGMIGLPGASLYCISKAGMIHFTKTVALEYAKQGIRANCVCPAAVDTDFLAPLISDEKAKEWLYSIHPMGRIGKPEEVAKAILYLVSDDTAWVTGSVLTMDGGQTLQ
ncbi:MAG: hypothetical protein A3J74_09740 [Elusimicrobia bacterium RIFCSPHIGHO2_02_FULL_57_9]|nr:MAG: hypothetical protein A3J74_09740 [Elusimicrobia bacterium RIFCSPHIGHO2_02_FULL_57_9]